MGKTKKDYDLEIKALEEKLRKKREEAKRASQLEAAEKRKRLLDLYIQFRLMKKPGISIDEMIAEVEHWIEQTKTPQQ